MEKKRNKYNNSQSPDKKKLSIEKCTKILNKGDREYSEEEVKKIREFLYQLATLQVENFKESQYKKHFAPNNPTK